MASGGSWKPLEDEPLFFERLIISANKFVSILNLPEIDCWLGHEKADSTQNTNVRCGQSEARGKTDHTHDAQTKEAGLIKQE